MPGRSVSGPSRGRKSSHRKTRKNQSSRKRSEAARKGWDTRTRKDGVKQVFHAIGSLLSESYGAAKAVKDIAIGTVKIAVPRSYRKNRWLKRFDKMF